MDRSVGDVESRTPVEPAIVEHAERDAATQSTPKTPTSPIPTPPTRDNWRERYGRRLWISDLLVLVWAVFGTHILWFGLYSAEVTTRPDSHLGPFPYWVFSIVLVAAWMWALSLIESRNHRIIGTGSTEYVRTASAGVRLFGFIAILAFLLRVDIARGYLLIALPLGVVLIIVERWIWRQWLIAQRHMGRYSARVLLIGSERSVADVARELQRASTAGYHVVGACEPSGRIADTIAGTDVPIMGSVNNIERALAATGADTVIVTSTDDLPANKVKQLSWALEKGHQHLVLAPSITDIAGPRIHTRPVSGLPLMHVETPIFTRGQRFMKRAMDLILSSVGVIIISPLLLALAILVRASGSGPVLFKQTRVGYEGREFTMLKFRSMVVNAEELLPALKEAQDAGNEVLFKMTNDPRVTKVGRFMRRFSLDELPQALNVIGGSMSLVGPRPPLPDEVARYASHVHRRFLAKPGITGLWQVSGRSMLSWEESVRLDLAYVENWSLLGDIIILGRTVRAATLPGASAH